ncbi:MAG: transcription activator, effector binding protein [Phycisphaerales bacterium]|nr:transcription activator, effector binding protein [Phycisphaerales bacterium]
MHGLRYSQFLRTGLSYAVLLFVGIGCQVHPRALEPLSELPLATRPDQPPYSVSRMHVQTMPQVSYCYVATRSSFQDLPRTAGPIVAALQQSVIVRSAIAGPRLFIYHDPSEDPSKPCNMEIGYPVGGDTPAPAGLQMRRLPAFRCAAVIYRGSMRHLDEAYAKLIPEIIAAGYIPSEESRESYLVWEGPDSPRNVVQIEVGIR